MAMTPTRVRPTFYILHDSLAWDASSSRLVYSSSDGRVSLLSKSSGATSTIFNLREAAPDFESSEGSQTQLHDIWSPDGENLAVYGTWVGANPQQAGFAIGNPARIMRTGLWILRTPRSGQPVTGQAAVVDPNLPADRLVDHASWSPDDKQLAYLFRGEAWVYDLGMGLSHRLTNLTQKPLSRLKGSDPFDGVSEIAWSPDGKRLALGLSCNCPSPWSGVGVLILPDGEPRLVVDGGNGIGWDTHGRITFRNAPGDWSIGNTYDYYAVQPGLNEQPINLTRSNPAYDPLLDPADRFHESDGRQVVGLKWGTGAWYFDQTNQYNGGVPGGFDVEIRTDGGGIVWNARGPQQAGDEWAVFPDWLTNGALVYFQADPAYPNPQNEMLFHLRRAMARETPLLAVDLYASAAAWAPDGSAVALLTTEDTNSLPGKVQVLGLK
jgi:hypothetical protein